MESMFDVWDKPAAWYDRYRAGLDQSASNHAAWRPMPMAADMPVAKQPKKAAPKLADAYARWLASGGGAGLRPEGQRGTKLEGPTGYTAGYESMNFNLRDGGWRDTANSVGQKMRQMPSVAEMYNQYLLEPARQLVDNAR